MTIADVKSTTEHKMQKSVEALKIDPAAKFANIRGVAGCANP